ncbi:SDR family oxidoreductase [Nocardia sp. NPDC002869]|uniref:SDR family oxidoreductase n=1 Tax=Nocardia sp. NPDC002869 TaxID=3161032 RepID=UPI00398D03FC
MCACTDCGSLRAAAERGGKADLVLTGSIGGHVVFPEYSIYCASKAAVAHLARNLLAEFGPRGIRVKNIEPGFTGTELGSDMHSAEHRAQLEEWRTEITIPSPEDIAEAVAFAVSVPGRMNVAAMILIPTQQG